MSKWKQGVVYCFRISIPKEQATIFTPGSGRDFERGRVCAVGICHLISACRRNIYEVQYNSDVLSSGVKLAKPKPWMQTTSGLWGLRILTNLVAQCKS